MKSTILGLLLTFTSFCVYSQDPSLYEPNGISKELCKRNKVRTIKVYERMFIGKIPFGRRHVLFRWEYDDAGLQVKSRTRLGGLLLGHYETTHEYDSLGNDISNGKKYTYDDKGRILLSDHGADHGPKYSYVYNTDGKVTIRKFYWFGDLRSDKYFLDTFEYNKDNKVIRMERYRSNGTLYFYFTYEYDSLGHLVKRERTENNRVTDVDIYEYDEKGRLISNDYFDHVRHKRAAWYNITYNENDLPDVQRGKLNAESRCYRRKYVYTYYE